MTGYQTWDIISFCDRYWWRVTCQSCQSCWEFSDYTSVYKAYSFVDHEGLEGPLQFIFKIRSVRLSILPWLCCDSTPEYNVHQSTLLICRAHNWLSFGRGRYLLFTCRWLLLLLLCLYTIRETQIAISAAGTNESIISSPEALTEINISIKVFIM